MITTIRRLSYNKMYRDSVSNGDMSGLKRVLESSSLIDLQQKWGDCEELSANVNNPSTSISFFDLFFIQHKN